MLTRYTCVPIAQNGNLRKHPIAFAQRYFPLQTRKQELKQAGRMPIFQSEYEDYEQAKTLDSRRGFLDNSVGFEASGNYQANLDSSN